jgi:hypothetical protein
VIDFLGLVVFATVISIGLLDLKSGLGPFAMYRSAAMTDVRRPAPATGRRGDDIQPRGQIRQEEAPDEEVPETRRGE